jgi:hypothetical protein
MADAIPSPVSIALLLAGKVWRNLPAVCDPTAFVSPWQRDPSTRQIPRVVVGPSLTTDGVGEFTWTAMARRGINVPLLSKTVVVDVAVQAQTISSVTGGERFQRNLTDGASSPGSTTWAADDKEVVETC